MDIVKLILIIGIVILSVIPLGACGIPIPAPIATSTAMASFTTFTPSPIPTTTPVLTNTNTATPEPEIAPNCKIVNDSGQFYVISDREFRDLRMHYGILDQALAVHYPEWANYTQKVQSSLPPLTLGQISVSASLGVGLQINPAVTLVTLGDTLDWQLPSSTDLYLKSQEISTELNRLSLDWDNPYNESLRNQYPQVTNAATYALYVFFDYNHDELQGWCHSYQQLFGKSE